MQFLEVSKCEYVFLIIKSKVATSYEFWEPTRTRFSKCNPNLTKPNTKNLDPNQTAIFRHNPNRPKSKTKHLNISKYKIFSNWWKIMLLLFLNIKFWQILIFVWLSVFILNFYIFKKLEKKFQEKVAKFLKNSFLVPSEQSRT